MDPQQPVIETVSALTARIKVGLEQWFRGVWTEGEISGVRPSANGHVYFTLKDARACLSCAAFGAARRPATMALLREGAKVRLHGDITVYEQRGSYQLVVRGIEAVGEGELMLRFEALKRRLAAEGLFDEAKKRPLPVLPRRIGIVTSPTGAAIRDMLNVTHRRFAGLHILLAPARVQGTGAAEEVADAIRLLNSLPEPPEVIIVGRGGGSLEDLWCFNEETVARAVRASAVPVISAVGHEIDFTICDFAADLRAPTPSAAAELVVKNRADLVATLASHASRLSLAMDNAIRHAKARVSAAASSRAFARPESFFREQSQHIDHLSERMASALDRGLERARHRVESAPVRLTGAMTDSVRRARLRVAAHEGRPLHAATAQIAAAKARLDTLRASLVALDPHAVLGRGYAIVEKADGGILSDAAGVRPGDAITTMFRDGKVHSVVTASPASPRLVSKRRPASDPDQPTLF